MQYRFETLMRDDFPMIHSWLAQPNISGWWGSGPVETKLMDEDMESGKTDMRIVWDVPADHPFAYIQDYDTQTFDMPHYGDLPAGARAIDTFLGDPEYLGKGHASGYLRQRAQQLIDAGAPCVVVDPSPENARAVTAYAKAGFEGGRSAPCEVGDPVRIMLFH